MLQPILGFAVDHLKSSNSKPTSVLSKRETTRANKEHGDRIDGLGIIGGPFVINPNPSFLNSRTDVFDKLWATQEEKYAQLSGDGKKIYVTLPNGDIKEGISFLTTPYDIAKTISQGLADNVVVAKVSYSNRFDSNAELVVACDDEAEDALVQSSMNSDSELWDLTRPLVGDCFLTLLKYDDPESKMVC